MADWGRNIFAYLTAQENMITTYSTQKIYSEFNKSKEKKSKLAYKYEETKIETYQNKLNPKT